MLHQMYLYHPSIFFLELIRLSCTTFCFFIFSTNKSRRYRLGAQCTCCSRQRAPNTASLSSSFPHGFPVTHIPSPICARCIATGWTNMWVCLSRPVRAQGGRPRIGAENISLPCSSRWHGPHSEMLADENSLPCVRVPYAECFCTQNGTLPQCRRHSLPQSVLYSRIFIQGRKM